MWVVSLPASSAQLILIAIVTANQNSANIMFLVLLLVGFGWMISSHGARDDDELARTRNSSGRTIYMGVSGLGSSSAVVA